MLSCRCISQNIHRVNVAGPQKEDRENWYEAKRRRVEVRELGHFAIAWNDFCMLTILGTLWCPFICMMLNFVLVY